MILLSKPFAFLVARCDECPLTKDGFFFLFFPLPLCLVCACKSYYEFLSRCIYVSDKCVAPTLDSMFITT